MATAMKTLNRKITHKIVPIHDEQMFAALSQAFEELADGIAEEIRENYVASHLNLLRVIDPDITGLVMVGNLVVITSLERVYYADIGGLDSVGVTTALIKCVKEE